MQNNDTHDTPYTLATDTGLLDAVGAVASRILRQQLHGCAVIAVWTEADRVRFRLRDGREGDVELTVNLDVTPTETAIESVAS